MYNFASFVGYRKVRPALNALAESLVAVGVDPVQFAQMVFVEGETPERALQEAGVPAAPALPAPNPATGPMLAQAQQNLKQLVTTRVGATLGQPQFDQQIAHAQAAVNALAKAAGKQKPPAPQVLPTGQQPQMGPIQPQPPVPAQPATA